MTRLVVTLVGDDRTGLVTRVSELVESHGGNWERSELAELAGAFAGIVLLSVPDERVEDFRAAVDSLGGDLRVAVHAPSVERAGPQRLLQFSVIGNDHPGIVREITSAISSRALSVDALTSRTVEAPMAGGTLFEATFAVRLPPDSDDEELVRAVERIADEIQVDLTVSPSA